MVKIECHFRSKSLFTPVTIHVLLPSFFEHSYTEETLDEVYKDNQFCFKTLFLLHGGAEDSRSWLSYSNIERYANKHKIAVVLPSLENSLCADLVHGPAYWTFLSDELPRFVRSVFPLSDKREDNFVAGLSMGGYGSLKWAFNKPEQFAAVACLSGSGDIVRMFSNNILGLKVEEIFGSLEKLKGSYSDHYAQLKKIHDQGIKIPRIYVACGTEDYNYAGNKTFIDHAKSLHVDVTYEEGPGGHDWDFWDAYIQRALDWMDSEK